MAIAVEHVGTIERGGRLTESDDEGHSHRYGIVPDHFFSLTNFQVYYIQ